MRIFNLKHSLPFSTRLFPASSGLLYQHPANRQVVLESQGAFGITKKKKDNSAIPADCTLRFPAARSFALHTILNFTRQHDAHRLHLWPSTFHLFVSSTTGSPVLLSAVGHRRHDHVSDTRLVWSPLLESRSRPERVCRPPQSPDYPRAGVLKIKSGFVIWTWSLWRCDILVCWQLGLALCFWLGLCEVETFHL